MKLQLDAEYAVRSAFLPGMWEIYEHMGAPELTRDPYGRRVLLSDAALDKLIEWAVARKEHSDGPES